ncbi:TerC/Alx family metal homeostasis membrane protein [Gulosibacter molinativorax]|uniref:Tellurium resistance protein TerC n=1 Tax=Gulosibacter molinativorax TaxID=256821 RepID=A0ABT7CBM0_9MICO|nr:TerC/Alx family metal homeostasis membrane protein [Gulosibacter molinativorax]MDJ1372031.1 tellurium resistance protein TerC [Gulosibacter molinativorax]QUY63921.1 Inner membrane protein alx [Gulosibacter molinativorax]
MGHVDIWVWLISVAVIVGFFVFDFYSHVKHAHVPSIKESGLWTLFYVAMAFVFMLIIAWLWDWKHAGDFIAGYATEKALSVDNLFVFLMIMTGFKVPKLAQQKALLIGIAMALVFRTIFIIAGAWILNELSWVFYIFGAWLLFMAIRQFRDSFDESDPEMPKWVSKIGKFIPASESYNGDKWTIVENGKKLFTPLVLVVVALGMTDILFALDSIPAIFGITQEPYLVFMANALALLGLRQMYFLLDAMLSRLVFLDLGIAFILGFIGVKLVFHAMHVNELSWINGGEPIEWAPEIPTWFSLLFIFGVLLIATIASLIYSREGGPADRKEAAAAAAAEVEAASEAASASAAGAGAGSGSGSDAAGGSNADGGSDAGPGSDAGAADATSAAGTGSNADGGSDASANDVNGSASPETEANGAPGGGEARA